MASLAEICGYVAALRERSGHNGHRALLWLSGQEPWCSEVVEALSGLPGVVQRVGAEAPSDRASGHAPDVAALLGSECDMAVVDAWRHSDVNAWLALAGTVRAGGLFVLCTPPAEQWPRHFFQQQVQRQLACEDRFFIPRLIEQFTRSPAVFFIPQHAPRADLPPLPQRAAQPWRCPLPSAEQCQMIADIRRVASGRRHRPLVIRADRGRGKTTALGLASAQLLKAGQAKRILLTSAHAGAVAAALHHCAMALPGAQQRADGLRYGDAELRYLAAEYAATEEAGEWDLVLVDEAAKLSQGLLTLLLQRHSRLVFATTVHGYEGSGRGFELRFVDVLQRLRPQWRRSGLQAPLRWAADDPLERLLNAAFVMDADFQAPPATAATPVVYCCLHREQLAVDEGLLRQVFGLLVQAHYQTTPNDLQRLLDGPSQLFVARVAGQVVAVCQCLPEGELDEALINAVMRGQRRPPGNLGAQRLAQYTLAPELLRQRSWRINRIAVSPPWRRRGLGSQLLARVALAARAEAVAFLSSSFALEASVLAFWQQQQFQPLYLGSRRDSSSGSYSLIVVQALAPELEALFTAWTQQLAVDLPPTAATVYPALPAASLRALLAALPRPALSPRDRLVLRRYQQGELIFEQSAASLWRLCLSGELEGLPAAVAEGLLSKMLLGHGWARLCREGGLAGGHEQGGNVAAGRAGVEKQWRAALAAGVTS